MAKNSDNVRVGYAGAVYKGASLGVAAPTDPTTPWSATDWRELGHVSEDGVSEQAAREIAEFKAWGFPSAPVRIQTTSEEFSFSITFLETNVHVLAAFYGMNPADYTSTAAAGGIPQFLTAIKGQELTPDAFPLGLDIIDGNYLQRIICPKVQITDRGDLSYKTDEMVQYQMTFKGLVGSDGTSWTRMWANVAAAA